jgi:hypothetical protein
MNINGRTFAPPRTDVGGDVSFRDEFVLDSRSQIGGKEIGRKRRGLVDKAEEGSTSIVNLQGPFGGRSQSSNGHEPDRDLQRQGRRKQQALPARSLNVARRGQGTVVQR